MQLFELIALMCLINTILPDFIRKYIKISRFWRSSAVNPKLQANLDAAREELDNIKNAEHDGEYRKTIRTIRAEQKVLEAEAVITFSKQLQLLKHSTIDTVAYYVAKVLFSGVVIIISARNRYSSVMVFDDSFSLAPLSGLLSFPTGVYNAISVPTWAFSCYFTFRIMYGMIQN